MSQVNGSAPNSELNGTQSRRSSHRSDDYWRHPGTASSDMVLIHVIDEHRKISKHYCCKRTLMLSHMRYFAEYLTEERAYDDVDISVHCDSDIFEWLLTYIHDPANPPPLDKTRVVSVLISSEFLLMDPLVELCLDFFAANLTEVIRLPIDLSCLTDRTLKGLAQRCSADSLATAKDKKGKLLHKLYKRRAEIDFSSAKAADLVQCCRCGLVYPNKAAKYLACPNASVVIEADGSLVRRHERSKPSQWSLFEHIRAMQQAPLSWECMYWYLWAACLVIRGQHVTVSALQVDRYVVDDATIQIQQPTYTTRSTMNLSDIPRFRLNSDTGNGVVQDQVDASTFGLGNITLLRSRHKHIAAAYAAAQELFRKQVLAQERAIPAMQVGEPHGSRSATPASLEYDIDDSSDSTAHASEPPPLPSAPQGTIPERPLSRGRSRQRDSLHRGRMRPMSADKTSPAAAAATAAAVAASRPESAQRSNRVPQAPAQSRRRSRSLSSGFVQRLESSLSLQQAAEQELARNFDIFNQLPDEPSGAAKPLYGVFVGPHPLSQMPKAYFSNLRKAQSSNQPDEKRIQWEMDLLREFDEKRLAELQRKIAQARKAFHATNKQSPRS